MVGLKFALCVFIAFTGAISVDANGFCYTGALGPEHWQESYDQCAGKHQSPINIDSEHVIPVALPPLILKNFCSTEGIATLINNGHTAMMTTDTNAIPTITGGPLGHNIYQFSQLHFHWGSNDTLGSEDLINGHTYPMEMHMVFFKEEYGDSTAALDHSDGLTVLAIFFEVGNVHNDNYNGFDKLLSKIITPETEAIFEPTPTLSKLLPLDLTHYFTYNGSLTTPPCSEVVTWIDFKESVKLSHEQFENFRCLKNEKETSLTNNFRSIQPLGDRVVLYNTDYYDECLGSTKEEARTGLLTRIKNFFSRF